ncbi:MAG: helix-turn-helix domain-containing protein [Angustibacter sp.]
MPDPVKPRPYRSTKRRAQAAATRAAVLEAARALFSERGYAATTINAVAERAGVAVDTVYSAVGRKPQLLIELVDEALAGRGGQAPAAEPTSAEQRDYVRAIRAAATADAKLATYAAALARLQRDVVPLVAALRQAGASDDEARRAWEALGERRARNMLRLAADLRATGELRSDLDDRQVADVLWTTNAPEYLELLAARGLDADGIQQLLHDLWARVLLTRSP